MARHFDCNDAVSDALGAEIVTAQYGCWAEHTQPDGLLMISLLWVRVAVGLQKLGTARSRTPHFEIQGRRRKLMKQSLHKKKTKDG
jgi:hypothetical protein